MDVRRSKPNSSVRRSTRSCALALFAAALGACTSPPCADFEDLEADTELHPGDSVTTQEVTLGIEAFRPTSAAAPVEGRARVVGHTVGGSQQSGLQLTSTAISVPYGPHTDSVRVHFVRTGGRASLVLNGFVLPWSAVLGAAGVGLEPGGQFFVDAVQVPAPSGELHDWIGTLTLAGSASSFSIGGEELWIDEVCVREDDCSDEPVDGGSLRFADRQVEPVANETRFQPLMRLGERTFRLSSVELVSVTLPEDMNLTLTVGVHSSNDPVHPLATGTTTVSGPLDGEGVSVPIVYAFPRNDTFAPGGPGPALALRVGIASSGDDALVETVSARAFPAAEESGRFAFFPAQRAPGGTFAYTNSSAYRLRLHGTCDP